MKASHYILLLGLLPSEAVGGAVAAHEGAGHIRSERIQPTLEPKSDKYFFKHDYPHDLKPPPSEDKWGHPFPLVQGTKDYEKDYVKDENFDGGQWKLQMEYDTLRSRLATVRQAREWAGRTMKEKSEEMEIAQVKETDAREKARRAMEARVQAEKEAQEVLRKAEARHRAALEGSASASRSRSAGAAKTVEQEAKELEDCKKELEGARARLKDLQDQKAKAEARLRALSVEEEKAEEKQLEKEQNEAALEEKVDQATKDYSSAHRRYEKSVVEEEMTERKMKESETQLRKSRHPEQEKKSSTTATIPSFGLAVIAVSVAVLGIASA